MPPEAWDAWLATDTADSKALASLLATPAGDDWITRPISGFVNRVTNDSPRCIAPVEPEQQRELF